MDIELRGETAGDEEAIDEVLYRAFGKSEEANIVRLMRTHYPAFDRRFSVAACQRGRMVGHTLFSPAQIRLMDETLSALAVGPVAVVPDAQRSGIGGQMLRYGHELGRREGFALAFLLGHPSYYPRHGYRACFGFGNVTIDADALPEPAEKLEAWPVRTTDLPWLVERLTAERADTDFTWLWGATLSEWTQPGIDAVIWRTADGRRAAYTLGRLAKKTLNLLLADDPALARDVIATLRPTTVEHHPSGWLAREALDPRWAHAEAGRSDAAMARELQDGALAPLLAALEAGRAPGCVNWPVPFLVC